MAFKFERKNNYFLITDTSNDYLYEGKVSEVVIKKSKTDSTNYYVEGMADLPKDTLFAFADIQHSTGSPFASQTAFEDFYTANTGGFSAALGGSNAGTFLSDLGWSKSGLVQFSQTLGKTKQFYTSGLTFKKFNSDGTKTTVTIPETDGITFDNINPFTGATVNGVQGVATFDVNDINNGFIWTDATTTAAVSTGDEMLSVLLYDFTNSRFVLVLPLASGGSPQNVTGYQTRTLLGALDNLADDLLPICWVIVSQAAGNYYTNGASGVYNYDKLPLNNM